jgi:phosphohistidine phosphatase SixA
LKHRPVLWCWALGFLIAAGGCGAQTDAPRSLAGSIVLLRHATAPGTGDPPGFKLGDCSTQRNLDASGRLQAQRIGQALRAQLAQAGNLVQAVWTSQWCRTQDTAALAFPEIKATPVLAFNSFFEDNSRAAPQTQAAKQLLAGWRGPGVLVVVTHQVNITALTGVVPASGAGVVLRFEGDVLKVWGQTPTP